MIISVKKRQILIVHHPPAHESGRSQRKIIHRPDGAVLFPVQQDLERLIHYQDIIVHISLLFFGIIIPVLRDLAVLNLIDFLTFQLFRGQAAETGGTNGMKTGEPQKVPETHIPGLQFHQVRFRSDCVKIRSRWKNDASQDIQVPYGIGKQDNIITIAFPDPPVHPHDLFLCIQGGDLQILKILPDFRLLRRPDLLQRKSPDHFQLEKLQLPSFLRPVLGDLRRHKQKPGRKRRGTEGGTPSSLRALRVCVYNPQAEIHLLSSPGTAVIFGSGFLLPFFLRYCISTESIYRLVLMCSISEYSAQASYTQLVSVTL